MQRILIPQNADPWRSPDGTLVCTYRESMARALWPFSSIVVHRSEDGGCTWQPRKVGGTALETTQGGLGEKLGEELGETRPATVRAMLANPKVTTTHLARPLSISTTAVEKYLRLLSAQGHPEVKCESSGLWVVFRFLPEHRAGGRATSAEVNGETPVETGERTREIAREKPLRLIAEKPTISTADMAAALRITRKSVDWQVRKLRSEGVLRRVGPARGGHWEVLK